MKILLIAAEAAPLAKVGGLADVVGALPKALKSLGHDARILMPQYSNITARYDLKNEISDFHTSCLSNPQLVNLNLTTAASVPVYTLDNPAYFGTNEVYVNDLERFYFFSRAVIDVLPRLSWQPDVIHCHDWMTALIIMWARKAGYPYRSMFTIHNLNFQGLFAENTKISRELKPDWDSFPAGAPPVPECFMGQAILWADQINTVSETYAREITTPEYGLGLDKLLRFRQDSLGGILNGIDYEVWNPQYDPYLDANYSSETTITLKSVNKIALQKEVSLPVDPDIPLIGMVQRLDEQKGLDILIEGIDKFLGATAVQIIILGKGRVDYQDRLRQIEIAHPQQLSVVTAFEEPLAHRIYAGCDLFLMPSRFEPCGLGQMIAMRYGSIPVVRHTGGLVDSVPEFNQDFSDGSGFVFHDYSASALFGTLNKALEAYYNRKLWGEVSERVSRIDFSWQASALKYEELFRSCLRPGP